MTEVVMPQAADLFLEYLRVERQYSPDTLKAYGTDIKNFVLFLTEGGTQPLMPLADVKIFDVRVYLSALYERGEKSRTIARKVSSLKMFYQFMQRNDLVAENPFSDIQIKRSGEHLPRFFYEAEMTKLFDVAQQDTTPLGIRNQAMLEFLYGTGLRVSELAALDLRAVDYQARVVRVTGKGNKQRIVPFGKYAEAALKRYLAESRPALVSDKTPTHHVWLNRQGGPLQATGIESALKKVAKSAGLTQVVTAHMFRHTYATDMLKNGADLRSVQQLLGHESLSTTQIYTHVTTESLQKSYRNFFPRAHE